MLGQYAAVAGEQAATHRRRGEIENIVTVALDIGERKRGEQEMRKARTPRKPALRNLRETQNSLIEAEKLAALGPAGGGRRS
jgi:C4-dicarboxylate-specific signal transduction histidine kinase